MKWLAELEGDDGDLSVLTEMFPRGAVTISREQGGYWLAADASADPADIGGLLDDLEAMVARVNGLACVLDHQQRRVSLTGRLVNSVSGQRHTVARAGVAEVRARAFSAKVVTDQDPLAPFLPGPAIIERCENATVDDVLRLWGTHPPDFFTLYKVVELIEKDVGGPKQVVASGWATARQLDAFGASANKRQVSGDLARHAVDEGDRPKRVMAVAEAREFVLDVCRRWLLYKAGLA